MASNTERAFDLITEISKQIVTLSTGLIALGITFNKDFLGSTPNPARAWLPWSWLALLFAVACAIWTLLGATGVQAIAGAEDAEPYAVAIRLPAIGEIVFFGLGLLLTVITGFVALGV